MVGRKKPQHAVKVIASIDKEVLRDLDRDFTDIVQRFSEATDRYENRLRTMLQTQDDFIVRVKELEARVKELEEYRCRDMEQRLGVIEERLLKQ